ncbi:phosphoenolpyruvate--protein phosphotransferase [Acidibrevibacterium fodinaquatile]|uniref:phosphoenolpyruvate--protein phosphotransferase n=1 Tax=Acidibrevibacterium fodinaquatile TaxID=1969806 RepID=UPI000E0D9191|nr:phosphoenolpyruvate--protein phosphotransferase [Acidibrevibacterium fodinaquatile]
MSRTDPPSAPPPAKPSAGAGRSPAPPSAPPAKAKRRPNPRASKAAGAKTAPTERRLRGIAITEGVAIGPVFGAVEPEIEPARRRIQAADIEAERSRLDAAITQSKKQLVKLRARLDMLPEESQAEIAPLIDAYLQMLGPSRLTRTMRQRIEEGLVAAETAVHDTGEAMVAAIMAMAEAGSEGSEQRASARRHADEVREISRRLIRNLTRQPFRSFAALPAGAILVCEYLRPADVALLDPARLAGVAADEGGSDGHTAIMLRALGVPAVLGVADLTAAAPPGTLAIVDGGKGEVILDPTPATLAEARRAVTGFARQRQQWARLKRLPAITTDHQVVELQANLELPAELPLIAQAGAAGIGLLRSEFLFMNRERMPNEDQQAEIYRGIIEAMGGDPVTIRVLDWSGEKEIDALIAEGLVPDLPPENPALSVRGLRLLLRQPDLFETQLAAILRAATAGPVRILLPMVTTIAELRAAREVFERVVRRLRRRGERLPEPLPPFGIMIETPAAALSADALALEADFFAIGSNDLTMYTLAVDRGEAIVAPLYDPLHPAVLRLMQFAIEAALLLRRPVSVCGELAANPKFTPLLLGLGLRSFSMNSSAVPRVKQAVRAVSAEACARFARRVMEQNDSSLIDELLSEFAEANE